MKKLLIPIALLLMVAVSCNRWKSKSNEVEANPYTYCDSVLLENEFEEGYSHYTVNIDLPITDNDTLRNNIMNWMLEEWTDDYQAYFEADKIRFFEEEGNEPRAEFVSNYSLADQNDVYVTYISEGYLYAGGAHSSPWYLGTTFDKSDGSIIGYNLFDDPEQLLDIISDNINEQWFAKIDGEEETDFSYGEINILPTNQPWIENDCVVFCYGVYEIAPYAAGMPLCRINIDDLRPYLSEKGKALFDKKTK